METRSCYQETLARLGCAATLWVLIAAGNGLGAEERRAEPVGDPPRTLSLAVRVDRDATRVVAYTVRARPYRAPAEIAPIVSYEPGGVLQIEAKLVGPDGAPRVRRVLAGSICLEHGPETPDHLEGDVRLPHQGVAIVDMPELPGFDRLELAYHVREVTGLVRRPLAVETLDPGRLVGTRVPGSHQGLVFTHPGGPATSSPATASCTPHWPEDYQDPDDYAMIGDETEIDQRVNIVILPDGYTYAQKPALESDAFTLITQLRSKSPFTEHDPFINYILVYAYSSQSGVDQCDLNLRVNSIFGTGFDNPASNCMSQGNCDPCGDDNIAEALLRAPAHDFTLVMSNSDRLGGCAYYGGTAYYTAHNPYGFHTAGHELGHSIGYLADEYIGFGCGDSASEINTSIHADVGAWPEWIAELGAPHEGAQYHECDLYRPQLGCSMNGGANAQFCKVCKQQLALKFFGDANVAPTAPIESKEPSQTVQQITAGSSIAFSVETRLAASPATSSRTWMIDGTGFALPALVASETSSYSRTFDDVGYFVLTCDVIADTNLVKPVKNGANRDVAEWRICVGGAGIVDCNGNRVHDDCDIGQGESEDCNDNGVPDECDISSTTSADCDGNQVPDECEQPCSDGIDCNGLEHCDGQGGCLPGVQQCATGTQCVLDLDQCLPPCPGYLGCGGSGCQVKLPLSCTIYDTGLHICAEGNQSFACPASIGPGQTIHVKNCDCRSSGSGPNYHVCLSENQSYYCSF